MSFFLGKNKIQKPAIIKKIVNETMHDKVSSRFSESRLSYGTTARQLLDVSNLAKKMSWQKKNLCVLLCVEVESKTSGMWNCKPCSLVVRSESSVHCKIENICRPHLRIVHKHSTCKFTHHHTRRHTHMCTHLLHRLDDNQSHAELLTDDQHAPGFLSYLLFKLCANAHLYLLLFSFSFSE